MNVDTLIDQGVELGKSGRLEEAASALRLAVDADPSNARGHFNLGVALLELDRADEALASIDRAIARRPGVSLAHHVRARVLMALNRVDEAAEAARKSIELSPENAEAHGVLAQALLRGGDLRRGFAEYEWRWKCDSFIEKRRNFPQPRWTGGKIADKTILLYHEQGFGDTIQFIRYAPLLAERGANVMVQSPRELADLIRRMPMVPQVAPLGELAGMPFDLHAPILSLPLAFGTTLKTIPANVPYLSAAPKAVEVWGQRAAEGRDGLRVGLAWSGRTTDLPGRLKSMRLETLAPLAAIPNVTFYSLQKWDPQSETTAAPAGMKIINLTPKVFDFSDSAALMANMDLIITVDTAIAHLAGAMGRPAWVMLPFSADFRWLIGREDSPWYPTLRLFRQPRAGDWASVVERVAGELRDRAASRNPD